MIEPMLASLADAPLEDPHLVYEPKYDGIRAIAEVGRAEVRLWSRLGNEKTRQFPEVVAALAKWARDRRDNIVLDGEIVALDGRGEPTGFQKLQGRIHLSTVPGSAEGDRSAASARPSVAFIAFDLLKEGRIDWRGKPLSARREALERVFGGATTSPVLRVSRQVRGSGGALYKEAVAQGWEGLIAKHVGSLYRSGKRTPDWRKLKIVHEQEFVVGGWTEPRQTRAYLGALLLGVYEPSPQKRAASQQPATSHQLTYVGHIGTGFNEKELARLMRLLKPLETRESPFGERVKTNERPHWVRPELVAQVKFTEWTADGRLRHPVYLGLRDDKKPSEVHREEVGHGAPAAAGPPAAGRARGRTPKSGPAAHHADGDAVLDQLSALEAARRDGVVTLPGGDTVAVTNLDKVFWPKLKLTKGDLFRYYARVAPAILPALADRPLVMKRFPNGIAAKPFYQHEAPKVPDGVRVVDVGGIAAGGHSGASSRVQIVGGDLKTLLYTTQLAAISQDPWFSRVPHLEFTDHVALDLDPADGVPFSHCLDVARWIRDELATLGAQGWAKTSGADGIHVYVPLPPRTPYDTGLLFCQLVATMIAHRHPRVATIERSVAARGKRVYVDYLQNIMGKTLASAYSVRASDYAGVSTPLSWAEVDAGVDRRDFTLTTVPARLDRIGDLWSGLRASPGVDLARITRARKKKER
ncbi:MAG TPA: DNA ligase D [Vicinamibacterales bacterium]|jgi:bifunctional non-homologous end joining protein LigD|nr:DNA ligase D [Vicinamibacterales bacterium]